MSRVSLYSPIAGSHPGLRTVPGRSTRRPLHYDSSSAYQSTYSSSYRTGIGSTTSHSYGTGASNRTPSASRRLSGTSTLPRHTSASRPLPTGVGPLDSRRKKLNNYSVNDYKPRTSNVTNDFTSSVKNGPLKADHSSYATKNEYTGLYGMPSTRYSPLDSVSSISSLRHRRSMSHSSLNDVTAGVDNIKLSGSDSVKASPRPVDSDDIVGRTSRRNKFDFEQNSSEDLWRIPSRGSRLSNGTNSEKRDYEKNDDYSHTTPRTESIHGKNAFKDEDASGYRRKDEDSKYESSTYKKSTYNNRDDGLSSNKRRDSNTDTTSKSLSRQSSNSSLSAGTTSKFSSSGKVGLRNIGNTCFMNSVLQCLSNTKPLLEYFLKEDYIMDKNTTTSSMKGALLVAYANIIQSFWKDRSTNNSYVSPNSFKTQIQRFAPRFSGYAQQDAQEFLRYLLEGLHEDVNRVTSKPKHIELNDDNFTSDSEKAQEYWRNYLRYDHSKIVEIFVGQLRSELKFTECGHRSVTFDPFWDLSLPIPKGRSEVNISDCLSFFMKEEVLDDDERPETFVCVEEKDLLPYKNDERRQTESEERRTSLSTAHRTAEQHQVQEISDKNMNEINSLYAQVEDLNNQLEESVKNSQENETKLQRALQELEDLKSQKDAIQGELIVKNKKLQIVQEDFEKMKRDNQDMEKEITVKTKEHQALNAEFEHYRKKAMEKQNTLTDAMATAIKDNVEEICELKTELAVLRKGGTFAVTDENLNFIRLCNAVFTICTKALRKVLKLNIPRGDVKSALASSKHLLFNRDGTSVLTADQRALLFPAPPSKFEGTLEDFDLALLYTLIRNISTLNAPVTRWGHKPNDKPWDASLGATVERFHFVRNRIACHSPCAKVSRQEFNATWKVIETCIADFEKKNGDEGLKRELECLKTVSLRSEGCFQKILQFQEQFKNEITEMRKEVKEGQMKEDFYFQDIKDNVMQCKALVDGMAKSATTKEEKDEIGTLHTKLERIMIGQEKLMSKKRDENEDVSKGDDDPEEEVVSLSVLAEKMKSLDNNLRVLSDHISQDKNQPKGKGEGNSTVKAKLSKLQDDVSLMEELLRSGQEKCLQKLNENQTSISQATQDIGHVSSTLAEVHDDLKIQRKSFDGHLSTVNSKMNEVTIQQNTLSDDLGASESALRVLKKDTARIKTISMDIQHDTRQEFSELRSGLDTLLENSHKDKRELIKTLERFDQSIRAVEIDTEETTSTANDNE